jgi:hypothetical protein
MWLLESLSRRGNVDSKIRDPKLENSMVLIFVWPCIIDVGEYCKWPTRCNNNNFIDLWISSTCFGQSFAHLQEHSTVVYSSVVYCPNVVVGCRSGVWRRRLCSVWGMLLEQNPSHRTHSLRHRTPDLQPTTTLDNTPHCYKPQSYAPEDGQKIARNMLNWIKDQ